MKFCNTNVKYHCEISWYFSVHCLPQSLRNYKEEAEIKPSEKALRCQGNELIGCWIYHKTLDFDLTRDFDTDFLDIFQLKF